MGLLENISDASLMSLSVPACFSQFPRCCFFQILFLTFDLFPEYRVLDFSTVITFGPFVTFSEETICTLVMGVFCQGFFEAPGSGCSYYPAAPGWPWHTVVWWQMNWGGEGGAGGFFFVLRRVIDWKTVHPLNCATPPATKYVIKGCRRLV